ncbi:MAG: GNAT family N-acetyltransferase [Flavobacterium sp.]|nr:GNAT family N-acetyltransferase [Flavobacterium sp.]
MFKIETERLIIREYTFEDDIFILKLLNDPSFIENIVDKNVRTTEAARNYLSTGPMSSYEKNGFGLWCITLKEGNIPIGMCGLIKRDVLDDIDIGYAFLPEYCSKGYAIESVAAVKKYANINLGIKRVVAVVNPDNARSIKLLEKMNFVYEKMVRLAPEEKEIKLFACVEK